VNLRKLAIPSPLLIGLILSGMIVAGAVVCSFTISTSMTISATYGITVFDTDHSTVLSSLGFGEFHRGDSRRFPSAGTYFIDSEEGSLWLSYTLTDWPAGVTLEIFIRKNGGSYEALTPGKKTSFSIDEAAFAEWYSIVTVTDSAAFGSYSPKIVWAGNDSA